MRLLLDDPSDVHVAKGGIVGMVHNGYVVA
jgi:hypothetical protein